MRFKVIPTDKFKKEAKRLVKKYPSLKNELLLLNTVLEIQPDKGTSLGNNCYKIRLGIKSKNKGKSGGARVITFLVNENSEVYLLTIYDKVEYESLEDKVIARIINNLK